MAVRAAEPQRRLGVPGADAPNRGHRSSLGRAGDMSGVAGRLLVVSSDSHVGPSLKEDLRPYCPSEQLAPFDEYEHEMDELRRQVNAAPQTVDLERIMKEERPEQFTKALRESAPRYSPAARKSFAMSGACPGLRDPAARHAD